MGFSPKHSTLVALVLNLKTRSISPQYHVVFDDHFSSVHSSGQQQAQAIWESLITSPGQRLWVLPDPDVDPELNDEWLTEGEQEARESERHSEVINRALNQSETSLQEARQTPSPESENPGVPDRTELQRELPQGSG